MTQKVKKRGGNPNPLPLPPGPGRPAGVPNKTTALLKEAILKAAELTGSDKQGKDGLTGYCAFLAKDEPKAFATLLGRVLPMQLAGDGEHGIIVEIVRRK